MKIITYNVNGLRAAVSKGLPEWLVQENPDILCLQETKLQPDQYPAEVFEALGYKAYLYSAQKKGYSGVAILTKQEPDHVEYGMGIEAYDNEGRFIRADFGDLSVVSVYHPSGTSGDERQAFKMVCPGGGVCPGLPTGGHHQPGRHHPHRLSKGHHRIHSQADLLPIQPRRDLHSGGV